VRQKSAGAQPALLKFDELGEGTSRLVFELTAEEMVLSDAYFSFPSPLQVELDIHRSIETFTVDGRVQGVIRGECCRCLTPVELSLEAPLRLLFQRKQASDEELEAVAEDEEVEILDPGAQDLDLVDRLRNAVLIELPVRAYCKEDCKGLCPRCGHDLNKGPCSCSEEAMDPRWEALRQIKFS